ncbi:MAG: methyltransferase domain-containing protein [Xanthomonadaceae bacterium]|jgi:SAM-dependent methyltransferase|nr:methyltransferase domain-containing protein [Xanthomonadaceae bacterium]MDE3071545.1 methyltransferase domain-containing protein [Pseudomonadota bacterium]
MRRPRDHDIYASKPLRRLLDDQMRAMTPDLQRCSGTHALLVGASLDDSAPGLPMLGCWTRLRVDDGQYRGDLRAAIGEPLPFVDDAFDLVLLRHALQAVPTASLLLAEAIRVLAPGGMLAVAGVHPLSGWAPWFYWHLRQSPQVLQMPLLLGNTLQRAGLEVERTRRIGHAWPSAADAPTDHANPLGGGYVLLARKRRHMATPLRIKPVPMPVAVSGRLTPGTRRSSAS